MKLKTLMAATAIAVSGVFVGAASESAHAATIDWTTWSSTFTTGASAGSASGTAGGVGVSYTGEVENVFFNQPSWGPSSTFSGGTVGNAPVTANGIIQLFGGNAGVTDTITFSQSVTDPVIAIWSLGQNLPNQAAIDASFTFSGTPAITVESGGPSNEFGGSTIFTCTPGSSVCGIEGNGTIQLDGTFSSISWTNPTFENWYGFAVGVAETPLPSTWTMLIAGFAGLAFFSYIGSRKKSFVGLAA